MTTKLSSIKRRGIAYRQRYNGWKEDCCIFDLETGEEMTYKGNQRCRMRIRARVMSIQKVIREALIEGEV